MNDIKEGEILVVTSCTDADEGFSQRMLEQMRQELEKPQQIVIVDSSDGRVPMGLLAFAVTSEVARVAMDQFARLAVDMLEATKPITYGPQRKGKRGKVQRW